MKKKRTLARIVKNPNFKPFINALGFTVVETALFFFSQNNVFKHLGQSSTVITESKLPRDKLYLGMMVIGNACTLIATQASFFVIIKNSLNAHLMGKRKLRLNSFWQKGLFVITTGSILNKSIATSLSALALAADNFSEPDYLKLVFSLAFLSNILVQISSQMELLDWNGKFPKWIATLLSVLGVPLFSISMISLNWNTLNNALICLKMLKPESRVTLGNMSESLVSKLVVGFALPMFLGTLVRSHMKYVPFVIEKLTPKKYSETLNLLDNSSKNQVSSRCQRISSILNQGTGFINSVQKTLIMFLAFAALIFSMCKDEVTGYLLGFGLSVLCLPASWRANSSTFIPSKYVNKQRSYHTGIALNAYPGKVIACTSREPIGYPIYMGERETPLLP